MSGETVPDINVPIDSTPGGIVSWLLGILCGIIAFLWKLNEGKNAKSIADLDARLMASDAKHIECENDRHELGKQLAVITERATINTERLNVLEKRFVHGADN